MRFQVIGRPLRYLLYVGRNPFFNMAPRGHGNNIQNHLRIAENVHVVGCAGTPPQAQAEGVVDVFPRDDRNARRVEPAALTPQPEHADRATCRSVTCTLSNNTLLANSLSLSFSFFFSFSLFLFLLLTVALTPC